MVLARELGATLAITGPVDFITDGTRILRVRNGHSLMPMVTGTGCSATAIIGAFAAVDLDPLTAAATGLAFFGLAGELAGNTAKGPGSFMTAILDSLYQITSDDIVAGCKISDG
jgi:hydroxyethylthiazole kinase